MRHQRRRLHSDIAGCPSDGTRCGAKIIAASSAGTNLLTVACQGSDRFNETGGNTASTVQLLGQGQIYQYTRWPGYGT